MTVAETALIARHIVEDPYRPGAAEVRLAGSGVSVWAIIGYLPAVDGDIERAAHDYDIEPDAVRAAIVWYHRHKSAIDERLAANAA